VVPRPTILSSNQNFSNQNVIAAAILDWILHRCVKKRQ